VTAGAPDDGALEVAAGRGVDRRAGVDDAVAVPRDPVVGCAGGRPGGLPEHVPDVGGRERRVRREHQRCGARDVRGRHAGSPPVLVVPLRDGAFHPGARRDDVGRDPALGPVARRRVPVAPVDDLAAGERRNVAVVVHRPDRQRLVDVRRRTAGPLAAVADRADDDDAGALGVPDRIDQRVGLGARPQTHADDVGIVLDGPLHAGDDLGERAAAGRVAVRQDRTVREFHARRDADVFAAGVAARDGAAGVRAVFAEVPGRDAPVERPVGVDFHPATGVGRVRGVLGVEIEVRMVGVDAGVQYRDPDALTAGALGPDVGGVDRVDPPGGVGRRRRSDGRRGHGRR